MSRFVSTNTYRLTCSIWRYKQLSLYKWWSFPEVSSPLGQTELTFRSPGFVSPYLNKMASWELREAGEALIVDRDYIQCRMSCYIAEPDSYFIIHDLDQDDQCMSTRSLQLNLSSGKRLETIQRLVKSSRTLPSWPSRNA